MEFRVVDKRIVDLEADAVIVNLFEGVDVPGGATGAVDQATGGLISSVIRRKGFTGKLNETLVLYSDKVRAGKIVVVGLGPVEKFTLEKARQAAGSAIRAAVKGSERVVGTIVHGIGVGGLDPKECAQALLEGTIIGAYSYDGLKTKKSPAVFAELVVAEIDTTKIDLVSDGARRGKILGDATNWARDMVNAPANYMTPSNMAEAAAEMARSAGLQCSVLDRKEMERFGMGVLLGVSQGSNEPPKLVVMKYEGSTGEKTLALVGKGITFDSGGISLKPGDGMEYMKDDMAGAAAVIAAMKAISQLKPRCSVLGVAACTENLPSGTAVKPGDVLKSMMGKTIEVISTDAEGRLILADAVAYAESLGATDIVDIATLTGAATVALGTVYSAIVANCDNLAAQVQIAASRCGERFWQLPSDAEYKEQFKSDVADLKNSGGREGGVITGGLIIGEFVNKANWAHLDIAATCFIKSPQPYMVRGATGVAVRTLAELPDVIGDKR